MRADGPDLHGRVISKVICVPRINVTLSSAKFSAWFLARIVESQDASFYIIFRSRGTTFDEIMTENQIPLVGSL